MNVHCEWGEQGLRRFADHSDVVIIVDVLSFSTAVDIATGRGAMIYPIAHGDAGAPELAKELDAELAGPRGKARFSLSPECYLDATPGTRVVLPSPNGGRLSCMVGGVPTFAGCLRNASAVAHAAARLGGAVAVIPAGERWEDGSLRFALEDWLGAGAIISTLDDAMSQKHGSNRAFSPESEAAAQTFRKMRAQLESVLLECTSGKELLALGYETDVMLAAEHDVSSTVPRYSSGAYVRSEC